MAGIRISNLPEAGDLLPQDQFPMARGSSNVKFFGSQFIDQFSNLSTRIDQISSTGLTQSVQPPNVFLGGPVSGNSQLASFRTLNSNDIPSLSASKISAGVFDPQRIPFLDAGKINDGIFNSDRIPFLNANKINDGVFTPARIPSLDTTKITSGIFLVPQIPNLPANKIEGVFQPNQIPDLDADIVTTGVFRPERIPFIPAGEITGIVPVDKGGTGTAVAQANRVFAGPSSGTSPLPPSFRNLVAADIPSLDAGKIISGILATAQLPNTIVYTTGVQTIEGTKTFSNAIIGSITGNAVTATRLQTARLIGGVSFDGTANINLPGVNAAGNQSTTGNAATATKLATARTINGRAFDGTANITISTVDNGAVRKVGDSMTGFLTLNADPTANLHAATKQYVDTFNTTRTYSAINRTYTDLRTIAPPGTGTVAQRIANPLWTTYLQIQNIVSTAKTFQINGRINYDVYVGGSRTAAVVDWFGRLIINDSIVVDVNGTNGHAGELSSTYHLLLQAAYTLPNNVTISSIKLQLANPNNANPVINNTHTGTNAYASNNNIYYSSRLDVVAF